MSSLILLLWTPDFTFHYDMNELLHKELQNEAYNFISICLLVCFLEEDAMPIG